MLNDLCLFPRQPFDIRAIQDYALTSNAEEAEVEWFYEDLQDLLELTPKKYVLFIIWDWNAIVESQEIPGVTGKFGLELQHEAGQRLIEFCKETALVIANTLFQQHKRRLYTWTSPDGQHQNKTNYSLCRQRRRSSISSAQFSSVSRVRLFATPMNCSTPGLPGHHQLPQFTQTHVHRVSDAIQLSHPLSSPFPPAPNPSHRQSLFQWVNTSHEVTKVLEFHL